MKILYFSKENGTEHIVFCETDEDKAEAIRASTEEGFDLDFIGNVERLVGSLAYLPTNRRIL